MSKQLILVSHGAFSQGLKDSTEMLMGSQDNIHALSLLPSESADDFRAKLEGLIKDFDEFVIFADLLGGTPCNVASRLLFEGRQFDLYAGMNLPMVIGFLNNELIGADKDIQIFGSDGIKKVNDLLAALDDDEDD